MTAKEQKVELTNSPYSLYDIHINFHQRSKVEKPNYLWFLFYWMYHY